MSAAKQLAGRLALARRDRSIANLGDLLVDGTWEDLRMFLLAFYELRDAIAAERRELADRGAPLGDRVVAAGIAEEIEEAIRQARRKLSRIARNRGRSRGWRGSGRPAGPSMAHGCAALASAVGPAPALVAGGAAPAAADRFSFCPGGQELPAGSSVKDTQTTDGGRNRE